MKKLLSLLLGVLILQSTSHAGEHAITFDEAITLNGRDRIRVSKVTEKPVLVDDESIWKITKTKKYNFNCDFELTIKGRDRALQNTAIGEHYFGDLNFNCNGSWGKKFTSYFSRVLVMGIRGCVVAETNNDEDYCSLVAVAMQSNGDVFEGKHSLEQTKEELAASKASAKNRGVLKDTLDIRQYFQIDSSFGGDLLKRQSLYPKGVITKLQLSQQVFSFYLSKKGNTAFIDSIAPELSSFSSGRPIDLTVPAETINRDQALISAVEIDIEEAKEVLAQYDEEDPDFDTLNLDFLMKVNEAHTALLNVFSPIDYFEKEAEIRALEASFLKVSNVENKAENAASIYAKYSDQVKGLDRLTVYLHQKPDASVIQLNKEIEEFKRQIPSYKIKNSSVKSKKKVKTAVSPGNRRGPKVLTCGDPDEMEGGFILAMDYSGGLMDAYCEDGKGVQYNVEFRTGGANLYLRDSSFTLTYIGFGRGVGKFGGAGAGIWGGVGLRAGMFVGFTGIYIVSGFDLGVGMQGDAGTIEITRR